MQPFVVADLVRSAPGEGPARLVFVARDGRRLHKMADLLERIMPDRTVLRFPAWDCLPYDRVSPNAGVIAERMTTLAYLRAAPKAGAIVVTTVNAIAQRLIPTEVVDTFTFSVKGGAVVDSEKLIGWANANGYLRVPTVREAGEFAVRGGLIDLFPAGADAPLRFDFFGTTLESIRQFDAESQRTIGQVKSISLVPMSEVVLTEDSIRTFRGNYTAAFGGATADDPLYGAISAGQRFAGMEHWLPFFYGEMAGLADYTGTASFVFDDQAPQALSERREQIEDYYKARTEALSDPAGGGAPYKPIEPGQLYRLNAGVYALGEGGEAIQLSPFAPAPGAANALEDQAGKLAPSFAAERKSNDINLFEAVVKAIGEKRKAGKKTVVACWSEGTRDRMAQVLGDHEAGGLIRLDRWSEVKDLGANSTGLIVLGLDSGFETEELYVLSEQDILGERIIRPTRRAKGAEALTEVSGLSAGDLVVHVDHGIGRFVGLKAIEVSGAPHDCVEIEYAKSDKLYLPVENIELLSRYGSDNEHAALDKLGGVAWQAKKAKLKKRIREIADQLIKIAAQRELSNGEVVEVPDGLYQEFCARFPFEETEDQLEALGAVFEDLAAGRIMDRLICGDVGFGKTEVALRAAFAVAMSGRQVAVVVPTTLLARQHYKTFAERFADLPVRVRHISRLVSAKEAKQSREDLADGRVDIVVGTHALLAKSVKFKDLGLLVVDEEQRFGVGHKERLKELKANVHVLTLSATPIPRTLQMALTGVRDLSLLATPPVDRLSVRSFVSPFDPLVVREALLREKYRGGQAFYVVPRIKDQTEIAEFLRDRVPEVSFMVAHGQMSASELDDIMNAFYDGKFDVLVSTTIVESGLDIPNANTLIVHRSDMFGLAQLHQIRGRIGRSKVRAYALFTMPPDRQLTGTAQRRLHVLQSLDSLGAGFQLASHDLDIRGAGNILGEEQSGHIKEVGFELYQSMLEEAVASLRAGGAEAEDEGQWSPQISIGMPVMIPDHFVPDLQVRMQLYRRLGELRDAREIDRFGAELIDRFGPLPEEVEALLKIVLVKSLCRTANVERVEAGPKGAVVTLRGAKFPNPAGLVALIGDSSQQVRLKPDQKLVFVRNWMTPEDRLKGVAVILTKMARLAEAA
ncbi:transcription-repair coupling factor [Cucumibacter marinus]|uniref:transcription-repair coupling factor n=1 Tax=Cucumibacter marinus TaxID=1121252 RepID=UPI0006866964|nr:transcription-repair coupling factor [Cucumibacter marinus]